MERLGRSSPSVFLLRRSRRQQCRRQNIKMAASQKSNRKPDDAMMNMNVIVLLFYINLVSLFASIQSTTRFSSTAEEWMILTEDSGRCFVVALGSTSIQLLVLYILGKREVMHQTSTHQRSVSSVVRHQESRFRDYCRM